MTRWFSWLLMTKRTNRLAQGATGAAIMRNSASRRGLTLLSALLGLVLLTPTGLLSAQSDSDGVNQSAPVGVTLESDRQTITSALRVDLTLD